VPEKSSYNYQELSDDLRKTKNTWGKQCPDNAGRSTLNAERRTINSKRWSKKF